MNSRQAIKLNLDMADMITQGYLGDLTDSDLMHRPDPKCNHIAWQLGHLISSDNQMVNQVFPGTISALPDGFNERYAPGSVFQITQPILTARMLCWGCIRDSALRSLQNWNR
ncbi:MAG: DinB family protein [Pirellulaceae bacterium]